MITFYTLLFRLPLLVLLMLSLHYLAVHVKFLLNVEYSFPSFCLNKMVLHFLCNFISLHQSSFDHEKNYIELFRSWIFPFNTSKRVRDLHDAEVVKRQRRTFQHLGDLTEYSSTNSSWEILKSSLSKNLKFMKFLKLLNRQAHFKLTKVNIK